MAFVADTHKSIFQFGRARASAGGTEGENGCAMLPMASTDLFRNKIITASNRYSVCVWRVSAHTISLALICAKRRRLLNRRRHFTFFFLPLRPSLRFHFLINSEFGQYFMHILANGHTATPNGRSTYEKNFNVVHMTEQRASGTHMNVAGCGQLYYGHTSESVRRR